MIQKDAVSKPDTTMASETVSAGAAGAIVSAPAKCGTCGTACGGDVVMTSDKVDHATAEVADAKCGGCGSGCGGGCSGSMVTVISKGAPARNRNGHAESAGCGSGCGNGCSGMVIESSKTGVVKSGGCGSGCGGGCSTMVIEGPKSSDAKCGGCGGCGAMSIEGSKTFSAIKHREHKAKNGLPLIQELLGVTKSSKKPFELAEFKGNKWSFINSNLSIPECFRPNKDGCFLELKGDNKLIKLYLGRKLEYERKCCSHHPEDSAAVTAVKFSAEHPYGKAVALLDTDSELITVDEDWFLLPWIAISFLLLRWSIYDELREMRTRVADLRRYELSGRVYMLAGLSSHVQQRATSRQMSVEMAARCRTEEERGAAMPTVGGGEVVGQLVHGEPLLATETWDLGAAKIVTRQPVVL